MNEKIDVLDHGYVRLINNMGSDLDIVRSARLSHNADWRTGEDAGKDEKLIRYLMKHGHNTPFECVVFTFEVKAPIFVVRQWHRHRTQSYNEQSARYTELAEEYYIPKPEYIGSQSKSNKQARDMGAPASKNNEIFVKRMKQICEESFGTYQNFLGHGMPRELARGILPLFTYTRMFTTVNLHNLFRFIHERIDPGAQWEIQQYAGALLELIKPIVPVAVDAFLENSES